MSGEGGELPRILLVEDNEAIRGAFSILLEESGYDVVQAATGAEALACATDASPHLILLDLGLPDMSGLEVTRVLRARGDTLATPIIALTGRALETDAEACRAAGCTEYLTKPINTEQLLAVLERHLGISG